MLRHHIYIITIKLYRNYWPSEGGYGGLQKNPVPRAAWNPLRDEQYVVICPSVPSSTRPRPVSSCPKAAPLETTGSRMLVLATLIWSTVTWAGGAATVLHGGWMRVAHLNMTYPTHHCPTGFRKIETPRRTCGRSGNGCYSTTYPVDGISYSWVCCKMLSIKSDDLYVDGVSLTHGRNPRKHILDIILLMQFVAMNARWVCPCTKTYIPYTGVAPPFVGNDYDCLCDTGSRYMHCCKIHCCKSVLQRGPTMGWSWMWGTSTCCQFNNPLWFCKQLPQPTTDDIELRLCADEGLTGEALHWIEQVEYSVHQ